MKKALRANVPTLYLMGFFHNFMVVVPVFVPLLQGFGLSMTEVLQTQALFALVVAVCEVPSGYIADLWGRRNAVIAGSGLNGVAFMGLLWADGFNDFLLYEFILGVGISLISGADLALLYDTEVYLTKRGIGGGAGASKSLARLISIEAAASGVAGIVASVMLLWSMDWLVLVQAAVGFLPFALALGLVEPPRPQLQVSHGDNARQIVQLLLFSRPVLLWTMLAIVAFGLLSLYSFWMYQNYWDLQGIPLQQFGYIWALFALTVSLAARYAAYWEQKLGSRNLLLLCALLPIVGLTGMALGSGWIGVMFGLSIQLSRGLSLTLFYDALNRRVPGEFRATVNSLVSLAVRAIFIVTGPLLGVALDRYGMNATLSAIALLFTPVLLLVVWVLNTKVRREAATEKEQLIPAND